MNDSNSPRKLHVKTCRCGDTFTCSDGRQRSCPKCVEARQAAKAAARAARLPYICSECGTRSRYEPEEGLCMDCRVKRAQRASAERRQRKHEEYMAGARREHELSYRARREEFLRRFNEAPPDVQDMCLITVLSYLIDILRQGKADPEPVVEESPEQVAHVDQEHIDAVAAEVLADIDL